MKLKQDTVLKNGEYKIIKTLGQGGFGITYLAYQIHLKRNVVIKEFFIKEYCDRESDTSKVFLGTSGNRDIVVRFLNKFHNEALNIAALKHPNIISIYDVFEENNTAYYVMEYHPNGSLGRLVDGNNGMSKERALHYIYQVADVLKYIHSKQIMHLDIKPDNILVDENDNAILIDFGLAKVYDGATNQQQTRSSSIAAYSPGYAPLEQYNPSGISSFSPTTDIYSLGATLFTLLTGKCPPLAIELINNDFIAQELLRYNVDKAIIDTIVRSMSPTTVQRPQSIGEFLAMLDAGETDVPQPASRIAPQDASQVVPQATSQVGQAKRKDVQGTKRKVEELMRRAAEETIVIVNKFGGLYQKYKKINKKIGVFIIVILCIVFAGVGINEFVKEHTLASKCSINKYNDDNNYVISIDDLVYLTMVSVAGGTFNMGPIDSAAYYDEHHVHSVTLSDYYIGETEVTQELWLAVMGSNPSISIGINNPVDNINYKDCEKFIKKMNRLFADKLPDGRKFRLPTEAQWEFAARGGNKSKGYKYSGSNNIDSVAWYYDNRGDRTHPVKKKQANELGLYDMSGNVWEWCSDWYDSSYYSYSPEINPQGPSDGGFRVLRGGSWLDNAQDCRVTYRNYNTPDYRSGSCGLRLAF